MDSKEIDKLKELIKSPIKNIKRDSNSTIIEFENGTILPLYGGSFDMDIDVPTCCFCGQPAKEDPLFTIDGSKHICKECTVLALETFIKNGIQVDLNLGDSFPDIAEQIKKLNNNLNNMKSE